jgi:hypothetical protein
MKLYKNKNTGRIVEKRGAFQLIEVQGQTPWNDTAFYQNHFPVQETAEFYEVAEDLVERFAHAGVHFEYDVEKDGNISVILRSNSFGAVKLFGRVERNQIAEWTVLDCDMRSLAHYQELVPFLGKLSTTEGSML